jgi:signal transduction histidine kinase
VLTATRPGAGRRSQLRDWALFVLAASIPTLVVGFLGVRALRNEEAALTRELLLLSQRATAAAEQQLAADLATHPQPPVWADRIEMARPGEDERAVSPAPRDCRRRADELRSAKAAAWKSQALSLLTACATARGSRGRLVWPLVAMDPRLETNAASLSAWIDEHGGQLRGLERDALRREIQRSDWLDAKARESLVAALRIAPEQAARALVGPQLPRMNRGATPIRWSDGRSRGWLELGEDGRYRGLVVHPTSIARAIRQGWPLTSAGLEEGLERGLEARLVRGDTSAFPIQATVPLFAGSARLVVGHPRPEVVARRSKRLLAAGAITSGLFAVALAALLFWRMRRARRLGELRTDFVAAVSHELRTPIASLRMLSELIAEDRIEPDERDEVHRALVSEAKRLGRTVDRLLGFSRMEVGRARIERSRVDLSELAEEAAKRFEARYPDAPPIARELETTTTMADPEAVAMALDNLLENARKYAPTGTPYRLATAVADDGVAVSLRDHGPGIATKDQRRIFRAFERANDRLSEATEGSGIGLSLVRHVARSHGGRASVSSAAGDGATFTIWLPNPTKS